MTAVPRGTVVRVPKKRPPKIAFAHFVWHFIVGKPWDSTTIIAKKLCLGSTRRFHLGFLIIFYGIFGVFLGISWPIIGLNWLINTLEL